MSRMHTLLLAAVLTTAAAHAQTELPKGYSKGQIVLADGTTLDGLVKNNLRKNASVYFMADEKADKKEYDGTAATRVVIDGEQYITHRGDFFKVISNGSVLFLQKSSDASGKVTYNGNEAVFASGTDGRPGDYFISDSAGNKLTLLTKRNTSTVALQFFENDTAAIEKAKAAGDDLSKFSEAVAIYNTNKK